MRLPEVVTRLRELAVDLGCDELNELADEFARRPSGQRAPDDLHADDRFRSGLKSER